MSSQQQQRYRVLQRIAAGGMAEVFRAESAGLEGFKKKVAIKRVLPHLAEKAEFIAMFLDEARLSAHLNHSNCVQVFDIGRGDSTYFIVMEMVDGADLKAIIEAQRRGGLPFPTEEACLICVRICEGLAYAHELHDEHAQPLNIVHRDMSPPNVLITRYGEVKVADFGLAKANSSLEQSQPGVIKGKFGYLSPEAAQGREVDQRTDIFAVGIILWEMLAGRRLFQGKTDLQTVKLVQRAEVPDVRQFNPAVAPSVVAVLARALAADPNERYQSARQLGYDLNHVLFKLPRAVSSFDIAQLVLPVSIQREREQAAGSHIGSLIDQALFQFTSLKDRGNSPVAGSAPLDVHSFAGRMPTGAAEDAVDWSASLGAERGAGATEDGGPGSPDLAAGNLSALEDVSDEPPSMASLLEATDEPAPAPRRRGRAGLVVTLVVVALLGAAAGAYVTGTLPLGARPGARR
jgi:serine/threonine-protein kinase